MHTTAVPPELLEGARGGEAEVSTLLNVAGATIAALGVVDLLIGLLMFGGAATHDATYEGGATAAAMRAYGIRSAFAGAVNLAFVWAVFAEPGARTAWLLLPLGLATTDVLADVAAFGSGQIPVKILVITVAVHEVLIAAVAATVISQYRGERPPTKGRNAAPR